MLSRRNLLLGMGLGTIPLILPRFAGAAQATSVLTVGKNVWPPVDVTFLFSNDVHACRMLHAPNPICESEGKTDANLIRHVKAMNSVQDHLWPLEINGKPSGLASAGQPIAAPQGLVLAGDLTDDGGGQTASKEEGDQLVQFAEHYSRGEREDQAHMDVYLGLGNHDLDQDGRPPNIDWYRREMRDYVELNHKPGVFAHPRVPVSDYDDETDNYSWDWGGLHLVQCQRYAGDIHKGAVNSLNWLAGDLKTYASDGRPVILFQHYGWDHFSIEKWDPTQKIFDDTGAGEPHWWSEAEREAFLAVIKPYNVIGLFHGHEHPSELIYNISGVDIFKPKAAYMGGFALVRVSDQAMDVAFLESEEVGRLEFTRSFSKSL